MKKLVIVGISILIVLLLFQTYRIHNLNESFEQEQVKSETESYKTEMVKRQLIRQSKEEMFNHQDSIRQSLIDSLLSTNNKYKRKTKDQIKAVKIAPDSFKDSLWIDEWRKTEQSLLDNKPDPIK